MANLATPVTKWAGEMAKLVAFFGLTAVLFVSQQAASNGPFSAVMQQEMQPGKNDAAVDKA